MHYCREMALDLVKPLAMLHLLIKMMSLSLNPTEHKNVVSTVLQEVDVVIEAVDLGLIEVIGVDI